MFKNFRQKGATLIEMVIVIILIGILSTAGIELVRLGFLSYHQGNQIIDAHWAGQRAITKITQDLRAIRATSDFTTTAANQLTFTNIENTPIDYQLNGTNLVRNSQILASHVTNLTFKYYQENGTELTDPINQSLIRYITVDFTIDRETSFQFITGVALWNII